MQDKLLQAREYIRSRFPELADVEPAASEPAPGITIFTFRKTFETPDGSGLSQIVKVTIDAEGRVTKVTTSR